MRGSLPDDLREVTPALEQSHAGAVCAVQVVEEALLVVVHQVGDHLSNLVLLHPVPDVLTVPTTVDAPA